MSFKARTIVILAFVLTTLALTIATAYTTYVYIGVYKGTRNLTITIQSFTVNVFNSTEALIETDLTVQNPSEFSFRVLHIQQKLYLEDQYFWVDQIVFPSYHPKYILPFTNDNMTFNMDVPALKIHLISQTEKQDWFMVFTILLEGPLVGIFDIKKFETLQNL